MAQDKEKLELRLCIHQTAAALRFGGDGYFVTFAGTEEDKDKAAALLALNGVPLLVTIEVDDGTG
jgi:hypothetical protein